MTAGCRSELKYLTSLPPCPFLPLRTRESVSCRHSIKIALDLTYYSRSYWQCRYIWTKQFQLYPISSAAHVQICCTHQRVCRYTRSLLLLHAAIPTPSVLPSPSQALPDARSFQKGVTSQASQHSFQLFTVSERLSRLEIHSFDTGGYLPIRRGP